MMGGEGKDLMRGEGKREREGNEGGIGEWTGEGST